MPTKVQTKIETYNTELIKELYEMVSGYDGAINDIAEKTGYHRETVRLTFLGLRKKSFDPVMNAAREVIKEHEAKKLEKVNKVKALLAMTYSI